MTGLADMVHGFAGVRVLVLGDALVDGYLEGDGTRLTPDGPTSVVEVRHHLDLPGGAAGAAANVAALGGRATLLSVVGDDPDGRALRRRLRDAGVQARLNLSGARRTLARRRIVADGGALLRYDEGDVWPVPAQNEAWLLDRLPGAWPQADAVLVSDAGYGVMTPAVRAELRRLQLSDPRLLVVQAHDPGEYADAGTTVAVLDAREALLLAGPADGREHAEALERHTDVLLAATGAELVAVKFGTDGGFFAEAGRPSYRTYAHAVPERESSGAGQTFAAALTLALGAGAQTWTAAEVATAAAAVAASKGRTAVCLSSELARRLSPLEKVAPDVRRLAAELDDRRAHGQRIVFTAGCFCGLHRGHAALLERARAAGDVLVVGVPAGDWCCDTAAGRPEDAPAERVAVLAGLSCVSAIVPFMGGSPDELIRSLRPDVVVTGGRPESGAAHESEAPPVSDVAREAGTEVVVVPRVDDVSATSLVERIRAARLLVRAAEHSA